MAKRYWWQQNVIVSVGLFLVLAGTTVTNATSIGTSVSDDVSGNAPKAVDHAMTSYNLQEQENLYVDDTICLQTTVDADEKAKQDEANKKAKEEEQSRKNEAIASNGNTSGRFRLSTVSDSDSTIVATIDKFLAGYPLAGSGQTFLDAGKQYNVDPYFLVAIATEESGRGTSGLARSQNNFFGRKSGGGWASYTSKSAGITNEAQYISEIYLNVGLNNIDSIGRKYCEGNAWANKIRGHLADIRG